MGLRKRIGLAAGLLALGVGIFATKTWVEARSSIRRATDHWVDNASLPVSVRPITPAPTPFQPVPMEPAYTSAIAFDGDLWFSGRGGLERRNSSTGELLARWRVGTELPPAPLTALVMARLGPASEPRLLAATAGEGLLSISSAGDILQILSDEPSLADLTSALPLSTGGVLLGTQRAGLIVWDGEALRRVHSQLTGQEVTALAGEDGDLWIGTLNQGVLHWSGGSLKQFGEEQGLPDKQVLSLAAGSAGVYVGTPIGVASFRDGAFERVLADGFFAAALHLSDVTLMVGTIDEGTIELPLGQERQPRSTGPRIAASGPDNVTAFASSGSSVVAATSSAAYLRAADSSSWRSLFETSGAGLRDRNVAALHVDSSNRLWTGYFDRGLDVLDAAFERVAEIENDEIFCVNRIKAAQDNGTTAVATANGLAYFDASARMRQFLTHAD